MFVFCSCCWSFPPISRSSFASGITCKLPPNEACDLLGLFGIFWDLSRGSGLLLLPSYPRESCMLAVWWDAQPPSSRTGVACGLLPRLPEPGPACHKAAVCSFSVHTLLCKPLCGTCTALAPTLQLFFPKPFKAALQLQAVAGVTYTACLQSYPSYETFSCTPLSATTLCNLRLGACKAQ